jgi:choline dehydrogenase-like flavoprotein
MRDGATRAGIESRSTHRYERGCRGSGRCLHGCPNDAKQSTAINSLRRAADDGAHVFARAAVQRIEMRGDRATAAVGNGFRIEARRAIVVAASAVQSPNLLSRSGLRGAHLGEHFMAHPGTSVTGVYPDRVDMWTGASQGYEAYGLRDSLGIKFETINVPPEVAASRLPGAGQRFARQLERLDHLAAWAVALRAEAEGSVRPSRLFGDLVRYTMTKADVERLRKGIRACAEMHFLAGATEVMPGVHGVPESIGRDQLAVLDDAPLDPRAYSMLATHLFGGCRAGKDPRASVVDPQLRVHGVRGLYVMDASVFPTNTGVNPQHSIMAIALVAARRLAGA